MNGKTSERIPLEKVDEDLAKDVVDAAFNVHAALGPGLLESAYEHCLTLELVERGHNIQKQVTLPVFYRGKKLDAGYRLDLLVCNRLVIEIKAASELLPIHHAQLLTYLRLSGCRIGFLINFNSILFRDGIKRLVVAPRGLDCYPVRVL